MAAKTIRRAVQGTCVLVETGGDTYAEELLPSRVRVTLQRPRGSCLCLGKKSRQVAEFIFTEGPTHCHYSHALLDIEKLFKYSSKENTQIKICVEQKQGVRRVARVPLEEFLQQLLSTGPCQWFVLYVNERYVTVTSSSNTDTNNVPIWDFEGSGCGNKDSDNYEKNCAINDDTELKDMLKGRDEHEQNLEEAREKCVIEQDSLSEVNNITCKEQTLPDENMNDEDSDSEWITESEESLSTNDEDEQYNDEAHITGSTQLTGDERMTAVNDEPEYEVADRRISLSRLMISRHGAVIILCFAVLVAVFHDTLHGGDMGWGWRIALLLAAYANLVIISLDFFAEEDSRWDVMKEL